MFSTLPAMGFIFGLGLCAGAVYVLGFTILQTSVDDELRGRTFSALYVMARVCILFSFLIAPLLSDLFDALSDRLFGGRVDLFGVTLSLPGVRLTLWLGGFIMIVAGFVAHVGLKRAYHLKVLQQSDGDKESQDAR
jgi:MFS family permease